jgi:hypothetical protein
MAFGPWRRGSSLFNRGRAAIRIATEGAYRCCAQLSSTCAETAQSKD